MAMPVHLEVANSPGCRGQPEICAVGVGTANPAKLYFAALPQVRAVGRQLRIGDQLRAAARRAPPRENKVDMMEKLADFCPPPGLPPPPGLVLDAHCIKVSKAGRATARSPPSSDTTTPGSTSDPEASSTQVSEMGDECEECSELGHGAMRGCSWSRLASAAAKAEVQ